MERRVKLECSCVAQAKVIYGRFHPFISILYFHGVAPFTAFAIFDITATVNAVDGVCKCVCVSVYVLSEYAFKYVCCDTLPL